MTLALLLLLLWWTLINKRAKGYSHWTGHSTIEEHVPTGIDSSLDIEYLKAGSIPMYLVIDTK